MRWDSSRAAERTTHRTARHCTSALIFTPPPPSSVHIPSHRQISSLNFCFLLTAARAPAASHFHAPRAHALLLLRSLCCRDTLCSAVRFNVAGPSPRHSPSLSLSFGCVSPSVSPSAVPHFASVVVMCCCRPLIVCNTSQCSTSSLRACVMCDAPPSGRVARDSTLSGASVQPFRARYCSFAANRQS